VTAKADKPSGYRALLTGNTLPRVTLLAILAYSFWHDLRGLTRYGFAVGVDGYYYVLQIESLREHGHLYFRSFTPLSLYLLAGISYLTHDTILAVKVGAVLFHVSLCLGIFAVLTTLTRVEWLGVIGAALTAFSGLRFYMLSEFIANLMAISFLVWSGWCLLEYLRNRKVSWVIASMILLVVAAFSHRLTIFVAAGLLFFGVLLHWFLNSAATKARVGAVAVILFLWLTPLLLAFWGKLPQLVNGEVSTTFQWPFDHYAIGAEAILCAASLATLMLVFYFGKRFEVAAFPYVAGSLALWSLLVTLNPFLNPDRGWLSVAGRLRGLGYITAAILVATLIWVCLTKRRELYYYALALVAPLFIVSAYSPLPRGMQQDYLAERAQLLSNLPERSLIAPNSIIIAAHGDEFALTAALGAPSQHTLPTHTQYEKTLWLVRGVRIGEVQKSGVILYTGSEGLATLLIDDSALQAKLKGMSDSARHLLFVTNPHLRNTYGYLFPASN
jgi:hypothetical protein